MKIASLTCRIAHSIVPLLFGLAALSTQSRAAEAGFTSLFNGKDLTGWEGNLTLWSVRDGAITGQTTAEHPLKSNTFLIWKGGDVKNFELRAQFRLTPNNEKNFANSGIQYRSHIVDAAGFVVGGYQGDMDGEGRYVGMLYEEKGRGILAKPGEKVRLTAGEAGKVKIEVTGATATPAEIAAANKPREWNEYVIIAEGNHLRHFINGMLTADITDLDEAKNATTGELEAKGAKSGVLALQIHVGQPMTVEFKNIRLKTLP